MKKLVIVGAGDFGREVSWVVERINAKSPEWDLLGFVDDNRDIQGQQVDGYSVLGTTEWLESVKEELWVVCSIATGYIRKQVMERVLQNTFLRSATLIDPAAIVGRNSFIEEGCIVCAGTFLAISCQIRKHTIVNVGSVVGHDTILEPYCTINPNTNISGKVTVGSCCDLGTGTKVIQGLHLCANCTLGAGAVVVRDIKEPGTYVGVPVRKIK